MKPIGKVLKVGLIALLLYGVLRGVLRYNEAEDGEGISRLFTAIVGGISDATYNLIPDLIDLVKQLGSAGGG